MSLYKFTKKLLKSRTTFYIRKNISTLNKRKVVLGIETSCDDTGCAIVDTDGKILGEAINSQQLIHISHGGIIPPIAQQLHRENIEQVVRDALEQSKLEFKQIDAIATTVRPGLPLSLAIGMKYGKYLSRIHNIPFIPIHHMEAHALTVRMIDKNVDFPFLVLLISGGHCLIALAKTVDEFLLMGQSLDDAPGEAFDKTARRMKLRNLPEYEKLSGGEAIELAASKATDFQEFFFPMPLAQYRDCNFSVSGLKNSVLKHIQRQERLHELEPDEIIPGINNLCAGFQLAIARHLCHRVQRAMEFIEIKNLIPSNNKTLVVSGGVACNNFISKALEIVCEAKEYRLARPTPKLCTDNGIMIAWNGIEKLKLNKGIVEDLDAVDIDAKAPFGTSIIEDVTNSSIKCKWIKLNDLCDVNKTQ